MGTEREAMTLEEILDEIDQMVNDAADIEPQVLSSWWVGINAHLSRAAEPVGLIVRDLCELDRPDIDAPDTIIVSTDDLIRVLRRYLHPSEDARDAARYRWLREGDNDDRVFQRSGDDWDDVFLPRKERLDAAIDAAMNGGDDA